MNVNRKMIKKKADFMSRLDEVNVEHKTIQKNGSHKYWFDD
jgi:hypothetical protein